MIVDVFYFRDSYLREIAEMGFLFDDLSRFMEIIREGGYRPVARLNLEDFPDAFEATNHIDEPWWEKGQTNGNLLRLAKPGEFRSSMVGDIFATEKGAYLVMAVGFERLPDEASALLNRLWEFA